MSYERKRAVILKAGTPFEAWNADLQGALSLATDKTLVGHVFHDIPAVRARPQPQKRAEEDQEKYLDRLEEWKISDMAAVSVIINRLDESIRPTMDKSIPAREVHQQISETHKPSNSTPAIEALANLTSTRFTTTAEGYCTTFARNLKPTAALVQKLHYGE
ncbi:hypothetical protein K470DRAFT_271879 [Piedraia hortae CBS 480.64]|uniref:Uncharacterized protein n=1 Tax=Piedraia hortae CBS 480.64 TaxID=1314780 RepID=A0A6A7BUL4_9PEZI|nr:hypothetical protein K470DRAFT_271879 [Piedraia hortae CBS 480.64]